MISIDITEGRTALLALTPEWKDLVGDSFTAVSSQPAWYLAWLDAFHTKHPTFITARHQGKLVGVLPLTRFRTDSRGLYFTQVAPFARADYQPPVVAPEFLTQALPALLDAAIRRFGKYGVFWWPNIPVTDPSVDVLRSFFRERRMPFVEEGEVAPRLRLDGRDFPALEKAWSSSHRIDVRRQRKRLAAAQGPLSLWIPSSVDEAEPVLTEFFRVHDQKWLAQGFPGLFQQPEQQRHFRAMLTRLWGQGLLFSTVRCGNLDVSYSFGFFSGRWAQWYRPSYRSDFHNFSPSKVHIALLLEKACAEQWQGIDFLLGGEPYKDVWADETLHVTSFLAGFGAWRPSYLWFSRGKPFFRRHLSVTRLRIQAWFQSRSKKDPQ